MLIFISLAATIGASATVFALSGYGLLTAVLLSPFGGSLAAMKVVCVVLLLDLTRGDRAGGLCPRGRVQTRLGESSEDSLFRQGRPRRS